MSNDDGGGFGAEPRASRLPPVLFGIGAPEGLSPLELMEERRRGQILLAGLNVFGAKGFAAATVQNLIDEAGISRATFYRYFPDREACLAGLSRELLGWLEDEAKAVASGPGGWPAETLRVARHLVDLIGSDARVARVCGVESTLVAPLIDERRDAAFAALAAFLRRGRSHSKSGVRLPAALEEVLILGSLDLTTRSAVGDCLRSPSELGSDIAEMVLASYLGSARARRVVRGV